jgi:hypothetical protein
VRTLRWATAALSLSVGMAYAADRYHGVGIGAVTTCQHVLDYGVAVQAMNTTAVAEASWFLGFVSGASAVGGIDLGSVGPAKLLDALGSYCKSHPDTRVEEAAHFVILSVQTHMLGKTYDAKEHGK